MNSPRSDTFWPPVLLALALACVVAFLILARQTRPVGPIAKPPPGDTATVGTRRLAIEFLDVGQGDSALIRSPEGKLALVDAGPTNRVVKLLRDRGVKQLDLVVVTHHHADHYGGMLAVLKAFHPRVFLDASSPHSSRAYEAILREVRDSGMTAIQPNTDTPREIKLGSVLMTVLPQPPVDEHNENNNSIGLRVDFGDFAALLTGDSEVAERAWWTRHVPNLCADVSVLKLAHHGSRNGTDLGWLRLTRPGLAVASLGLNNDYGHPHPETLKRLTQAGVPLDRTDTAGSITIVTDGESWSTSEARSELSPGEAIATLANPEQLLMNSERSSPGSRARKSAARVFSSLDQQKLRAKRTTSLGFCRGDRWILSETLTSVSLWKRSWYSATIKTGVLIDRLWVIKYLKRGTHSKRNAPWGATHDNLEHDPETHFGLCGY